MVRSASHSRRREGLPSIPVKIAVLRLAKQRRSSHVRSTIEDVTHICRRIPHMICDFSTLLSCLGLGCGSEIFEGEGDKKAGGEDEDGSAKHHQSLATDNSCKHLFVVSGFGSLILKWTLSKECIVYRNFPQQDFFPEKL
jgi:hypothetical protein